MRIRGLHVSPAPRGYDDSGIEDERHAGIISVEAFVYADGVQASEGYEAGDQI